MILIGSNLSDPIEQDEKGKHVYKQYCHNINICKSYGEISFACLAGANANTRCSLGEKMRIRVLNDSTQTLLTSQRNRNLRNQIKS